MKYNVQWIFLIHLFWKKSANGKKKKTSKTIGTITTKTKPTLVYSSNQTHHDLVQQIALLLSKGNPRGATDLQVSLRQPERSGKKICHNDRWRLVESGSNLPLSDVARVSPDFFLVAVGVRLHVVGGGEKV
jgi:hypothetical protein